MKTKFPFWGELSLYSNSLQSPWLKSSCRLPLTRCLSLLAALQSPWGETGWTDLGSGAYLSVRLSWGARFTRQIKGRKWNTRPQNLLQSA